MNNDLTFILNSISQRLDRAAGRLDPPYIYLDAESVNYLFQELCGLEHPPDIVLSESEVGLSCRVELEPDRKKGFPLPAILLFDCMYQVLKDKASTIKSVEDISTMSTRYAFISGLFQTTRFPDGNLNLEINFAGIRGILFYHKDHFGPLVRPLIDQDRFYTFSADVEALVYFPDRIQRTIFYHQTYGDNKEHDWSPLVPICIKNSPDKEESPQFK